MTLYFALKFLHVIGAAVLLGTGAGIAFFMLLAHRTGDAATIAGIARIVVVADFLFTATAVVAQPVTGLLLARKVGYTLSEGWIVLSMLLYLLLVPSGCRSCGCRCACAISPLPPPGRPGPCRSNTIACSGCGSRSASRPLPPCLASSG